MYSIDSSKTAVNNFNEYLKFYLFKLQSSLDTVNMELNSETELSKIKDAMTAREILKYEDTITRLDKTISVQFEIIRFYLNAGAFEAPQVYNAIKTIKSSDILNSTNRFQSNNMRKAELVQEINKIKDVLENKEVDFDYYVSLLNSSNLVEKDKISLLALKAFESTKYIKKDKTPSFESIISSVESKEKVADFSRLVEKFNKLMENANPLKNKFYYLFEGKNSSQLSYHFEAVKASGNDFIENVKKYSYKEGAMIACLYHIAEIVEDIKTINTNGSESDKELYEIYLDDMEKTISVASEVAVYLEEINKEQKPSSILYLTDTHGRVLFDLSEFNSDDRKNIEALIYKLENGQFDYLKSGIKSAMVNGSITPICVNKLGRMCCSYIKLDDDMVLLLTFDTKKEIFDKTLSIEKKYIDYIKRIKEDFKKISEEEKVQMINEQDELRFNLNFNGSEAVL